MSHTFIVSQLNTQCLAPGKHTGFQCLTITFNISRQTHTEAFTVSVLNIHCLTAGKHTDRLSPFQCLTRSVLLLQTPRLGLSQYTDTGLCHYTLTPGCVTTHWHQAVSQHTDTRLCHNTLTPGCVTTHWHQAVSQHTDTRLCHNTLTPGCVTTHWHRAVSQHTDTGLSQHTDTGLCHNTMTPGCHNTLTPHQQIHQGLGGVTPPAKATLKGCYVKKLNSNPHYSSQPMDQTLKFLLFPLPIIPLHPFPVDLPVWMCAACVPLCVHVQGSKGPCILLKFML